MKLHSTKIYQKLYNETGIQKVAEILFEFPEKEFSLSDLAKEAGVAKANIGSMLKILYKAEFIEITKLNKIWRIKAKQNSWNFIKAKIVRNIHLIYQSNIVEFLNDYYKNPKAIVLFGSFRKGEDMTGSDIDIAIETDEVQNYKILNLKELADFENILGRKIQIHIFNRKDVDINVFNNIANGIVLGGFLEVRK
ncbi:MAG: nucleotidyltransferase domain-containing protein [Candidatus Aenigmarchaeota archaeon]|nr:nucleotidyltransferase domain-containing protein [Candidatus Aenigmarchaeota archaeon]